MVPECQALSWELLHYPIDILPCLCLASLHSFVLFDHQKQRQPINDIIITIQNNQWSHGGLIFEITAGMVNEIIPCTGA